MSEIVKTTESLNSPEKSSGRLRRFGVEVVNRVRMLFGERIDVAEELTDVLSEEYLEWAKTNLDDDRPEVANVINRSAYKVGSEKHRAYRASELKKSISGYFEKGGEDRSEEYWRSLTTIEEKVGRLGDKRTTRRLLRMDETMMSVLSDRFMGVEAIQKKASGMRLKENGRREWAMEYTAASYVNSFNEKIENESVSNKALEWMDRVVSMDDVSDERMTKTTLAYEVGLGRLGYDGDVESMDIFMNGYNELYDLMGSRWSAVEYGDLLKYYVKSQGIDEQRMDKIRTLCEEDRRASDGAKSKLEKYVIGIGVKGEWLAGPGQFTYSEYSLECLLREANPRNVNEMVRVYETLPGGDMNRIDRIRKDALKLEYNLYPNHSFIHEMKPGAHDMLTAMLDYYDSKDSEDEHGEAEVKLRGVIKDNLSGSYAGFYRGGGVDWMDSSVEGDIKRSEEMAMDLEGYEAEFKDGTKVIDVLRRIVNDMEGGALRKAEVQDDRHIKNKTDYPITYDDEMNLALEKTAVDVLSDGRVEVGFSDATFVVTVLNDRLVEMQNKAEMTPDTIRLVSYVGRLADWALRGEMDRADLMQDPGFKEILRFNRLTASSEDYDDAEFEEFYKRLVSEDAKGRGLIDGQEPSFMEMSKSVTEQVGKLGEYYASIGKDRDFMEGLTSGNLTWTLMSMAERRQLVVAEDYPFLKDSWEHWYSGDE